MTCAAMRTSSNPQEPCSQSTKIESAPSSTSRAERPGDTWWGLNIVIASPFDRPSRSFAPFMAVPSGLFLWLVGGVVRRPHPACGLNIGRGVAHEGRADLQFGNHGA